ncbi:MAG TPA: hypothetical protein VNI02_23235 [Blastocatellia bacterium]|jgi:hypothetical protein|nr:hypothetical protein [Blastocatellia bacterium]
MGKTKSNSKKRASSKDSAGEPAAEAPASEAASVTGDGRPNASSVPDNAQLPATRGKASVFGGPKDRGFKPDDKLALPTGPHFAYERIRSLNPKGFYCAMRWDYRFQHMSPEEGKRWWANKKLQITNPKSGASVVVRAVDYGPHENTGFDISVSPGAADALDIEIGDEVEIGFADQRAALGLVK